MKPSSFLSISAGCSALVIAAGIFVVALSGMNAFQGIADYYKAEAEAAKKRRDSTEGVQALAIESIGYTCAKVLGQFKLISPDDERQIAASVVGRIEGKSATVRALIDAVERNSGRTNPGR